MSWRTGSQIFAARLSTRKKLPSAGSRPGHSLYRRPFQLEALEDRRLLAVVTVDTLADVVDLADGVTSLREAIFATNTVGGEDTIRFDSALTANGPATILLTQGELAVTDSLTINGPGADVLTIDASGNDPTPDDNNGDGSRVFLINDGNRETFIDVELNGMRLTGGDSPLNSEPYSTNGGGAVRSSENVSLVRISADHNSSAYYGGAVFHDLGVLRVVDSDLSQNVSVSAGGGIYGYLSEIFVDNSVIENNVLIAWSSSPGNIFGGGGIRAYFSDLTVNSSRISGNTSGSFGGGIALRGSNLHASDSTISNNSAGSYGGGIDLYGNIRQIANFANCTITQNTSVLDGGGIRATVGICEFVVSDSVIAGNRAGRYGGGITTFAKHSRIVRSAIVDNSAGNSEETLGRGGGMYVGGDVDVVECEFTGNSAGEHGGAIATPGRNSKVFSIVDSTIAGNSAGSDGGGLNLSRSGTIRGSTVRDNISGGDGGGILLSGGPAVITKSTISGNSAGGNGGGIAWNATTITASENSGLRATNTTISGNRSNGSGGGVFVRLGGPVLNVTFEHSTITANQSDADLLTGGAGGGVFVQSGAVALDHTIVAENSDRSGVGPDLTGFIGSSFTPRYSLIGMNLRSGLAATSGGLPDALGNLIGGSTSATRIKPVLWPLADNGGPTRTHALAVGSPAINAGDPSAAAGSNGVPETDQRGGLYHRVAGGRIDIGAFEDQSTVVVIPGDFNSDLRVDNDDLRLLLNSWATPVPPSPPGWYGTAPSQPAVDNDELTMLLSHWGIKVSGGVSVTESVASGKVHEGVVLAEPLVPDAVLDGAALAEPVAPHPKSATRFFEPAASSVTQLVVRNERAVARPAMNVARQDRLLATWAAMRDGARASHEVVPMASEGDVAIGTECEIRSGSFDRALEQLKSFSSTRIARGEAVR